MPDLQKQLDTMTSANLQLQAGINALSTEKQVLNQTLGEIMTANIQLRTALMLMEGQAKMVAESLAAKEKECADLTQKLEVANAVIAASTNLTAPDSESSAPAQG
jgi:hypothetical protein